MNFDVQIIGSNSAISEHGRHPSAQVVKIHHHHFLVDCGEGTQNRLSFFKVKKFRLSHIFISHLHGDHYFGLAGLITSYHLLKRKTPLHLYAPPALEAILRLQLEASSTTLSYEVIFHPTQDEVNEVLFEDEWVKVSSFPLRHRIPCTGFLFEEKSSSKRIDPEKVKDLALNSSHFEALKAGEDIYDMNDIFHENETLTLPPYLPRKYAYCSDTVFTPELKPSIQACDLLYHEATFMNENEQRATETGHSTTGQAAQMAKIAEAKKLIIGHFSSKYLHLEPLLLEAKAIFPETFLATEGTIFSIERRIQ